MRDLSNAELECMSHNDLCERVRDLQHQRLIWAKATEGTERRNVKLVDVAAQAVGLNRAVFARAHAELQAIQARADEVIRELKTVIEETGGK